MKRSSWGSSATTANRMPALLVEGRKRTREDATLQEAWRCPGALLRLAITAFDVSTGTAAGAVALGQARAGEAAISTWVQIAMANSSNATANRRLASSSAASS